MLCNAAPFFEFLSHSVQVPSDFHLGMFCAFNSVSVAFESRAVGHLLTKIHLVHRKRRRHVQLSAHANARLAKRIVQQSDRLQFVQKSQEGPETLRQLVPNAFCSQTESRGYSRGACSRLRPTVTCFGPLYQHSSSNQQFAETLRRKSTLVRKLNPVIHARAPFQPGVEIRCKTHTFLVASFATVLIYFMYLRYPRLQVASLLQSF